MASKLSTSNRFKFKLLHKLNKRFKTGQRESYSQFGEDGAILNMLRGKMGIKEGVYVDVGCNHPFMYSNTFLLYKNGWHGVTIDLNHDLMELHRKERPLDVQFEAAVSNQRNEVQVFEHKMDLMTTIDRTFFEEHKENYIQAGNSKTIQTQTLDELLEQTNFEKIDLLCIDVEGHDFQALQSITLEKYQPKLIVIEMHEARMETIQKHEICSYLKSKGYRLEGYLYWNGYFVLE